jgi:hypothetical protein
MSVLLMIKGIIGVILAHSSEIFTTVMSVVGVTLIKVAPKIIPSLVTLFEEWASKFLSGKISERVKDAIEKLGVLIKTIILAQPQLLSTEVLQAVQAKNFDLPKILEIRKEIAAKALDMIKPEIPTLSKYFLGESVEVFVQHTVDAYVIEYLQMKINGVQTDATITIK